MLIQDQKVTPDLEGSLNPPPHKGALVPNSRINEFSVRRFVRSHPGVSERSALAGSRTDKDWKKGAIG